MKIKKSPKKLVCEKCHQPFTVKKNLYAKFCSDACRVKNDRDKKGKANSISQRTLSLFDEQMQLISDLITSKELSKEETHQLLNEINRKARILGAIARAAIQKEAINKLIRDLN